jgi:hypothetical protein
MRALNNRLRVQIEFLLISFVEWSPSEPPFLTVVSKYWMLNEFVFLAPDQESMNLPYIFFFIYVLVEDMLDWIVVNDINVIG